MTKPTTFQIDLHFQPLHSAEEILGTLYTLTSDAIEHHGLINAFCNMHTKLGKKSFVFTEVQINAITNDVQYFVAYNPKMGEYIPALTYTQAIRNLRQLLA